MKQGLTPRTEPARTATRAFSRAPRRAAPGSRVLATARTFRAGAPGQLELLGRKLGKPGSSPGGDLACQCSPSREQEAASVCLPSTAPPETDPPESQPRAGGRGAGVFVQCFFPRVTQPGLDPIPTGSRDAPGTLGLRRTGRIHHVSAPRNVSSNGGRTAGDGDSGQGASHTTEHGFQSTEWRRGEVAAFEKVLGGC